VNRWTFTNNAGETDPTSFGTLADVQIPFDPLTEIRHARLLGECVEPAALDGHRDPLERAIRNKRKERRQYAY
jgi:hypothetical protein